MENGKTIYVVLGEPSGDQLAAQIFDALALREGISVSMVGLAGEQLAQKGVTSLFDIDDLSVMGIGPVLARLPKLIGRVRQTVRDIIEQKPDAVLLVDSPEFCSAVAKRVRKKLPDTPIIKYVCPSVWAWRPGRAKKMHRYVDHVLALLPFEPEELKRLGGPNCTYVGHPLTQKMVNYRQSNPRKIEDNEPLKLSLLPGSRRAEIEKSLPDFCWVIAQLQPTHELELLLPTLPKLRPQVLQELQKWNLTADVKTSEPDKAEVFQKADVALATSGTVSLELALARVPHIVYYKPDFLASRLSFLLTAWSINLPNIIADRVIVPELVGPYARRERLLREVKSLLENGPARDHQAQGFDLIWQQAQTETPPAEKVAAIIHDLVSPNRI